jgi:DNA-binding NarL/FixJ family response regulator
MPRPEKDRVRRPRPAKNAVRVPVTAWPAICRHCRWSLRELEVAQLLFEGVKEQTVARRLTISINTVKRIMEHIYTKMDVHSRAEFCPADMAEQDTLARLAKGNLEGASPFLRALCGRG